jgi:hypothetical protein
LVASTSAKKGKEGQGKNEACLGPHDRGRPIAKHLACRAAAYEMRSLPKPLKHGNLRRAPMRRRGHAAQRDVAPTQHAAQTNDAKHQRCLSASAWLSAIRSLLASALTLPAARSTGAPSQFFPMCAADSELEFFARFSSQTIWPRATCEYNSRRDIKTTTDYAVRADIEFFAGRSIRLPIRVHP